MTLLKERRTVRAIIYDIVDGEYRFLILYKDGVKKKYWQQLQGGVKEDEDNLVTLIREIQEEIGVLEGQLSIHQDTWVEGEYTTERKGEIILAQYAACAVRFNSTLPLTLTEHSQHRWVSLEQVASTLTAYPEMIPICYNVLSKLWPLVLYQNPVQ